jgi:TetR/AcrR family transcriptional repressor of nem operon
LLSTTSWLFRSRGVDAVGIADLMKDAGLTHGGFYNHFPSKEALAVEVFNAAFADSLGRLAGTVRRGPDGSRSPLERVVDRYLSAAHRDAGDGGCPSASLVTDAWRQSGHVQAANTKGVEGYVTGFAEEITREAAEKGENVDSAEARARAIRLLSELVGAMVLARAVHRVQPALSDEILHSARRAR